MTVVQGSPLQDLEVVTFDTYRDVHKGLRAELFALTVSAGNADPSDRGDRAALAAHVDSVVALLESHAHHEDAVLDPVLLVHAPALSEHIVNDHAELDARIVAISGLASEAVTSDAATWREGLRRVYLELAAFTSAYLAHQDFEERIVMPALERAVGVPGVIELHQAIVGNIPPDEMAKSLALMLPAMNVDDRVDLLGGLRAGAPAPVFNGVWGLVGSVVTPAERDAIAVRLGIAG